MHYNNNQVIKLNRMKITSIAPLLAAFAVALKIDEDGATVDCQPDPDTWWFEECSTLYW